VTVLSTASDGVRFGFVDDVAVAQNGKIYFTDASSARGADRWKLEVIEHRPNGRLLEYDPATGRTRRVLDNLYFANGVTLGPDDAYVLVAETASYRIRRVWLTGDKAGQWDTFAENLPGFPDNITWCPERKVFWVAIGNPRNALLDRLGPRPWLRKVVMRLPGFVQPREKPHAWALALDELGTPVLSLEHASPKAYASLASVIEVKGILYLGSFSHPGIGRIKAP
jgi:sugar lactone lactonase YvrE